MSETTSGATPYSFESPQQEYQTDLTHYNALLSLVGVQTDMHLDLLSAMAPDTDQLYALPGVGLEISHNLLIARSLVLTRYHKNYKEFYPSKATAHKVYDVDVLAQDLRSLRDDAKAGLTRSEVCRTIMPANVLDYYPYLDDITGDTPAQLLGVYQSYIRFAFGDPDLPVMEKHLADRMHELGVVDLSEQRLNERFLHLLASLQVEIDALFLEDLSLMSKLGGSGQAEWLAKTYKDVLSGNDYQQRLEMMDKFVSVSRRMALRSTDHYVVMFVNRVIDTTSDIHRLPQRFRSVFTRLGYTLPEYLVQTDPSYRAGQVAVSANIAEASSQVSAEVRAEHTATRDQMIVQAEALASRWRIPKKERDTVDFRLLEIALKDGLSPKMPTGEAKAVAYLYHLRHVAMTSKQPLVNVQRSLGELQALQQTIDGLNSQAREVGIILQWPIVEAIAKSLDRFYVDWPAVEELIIHNWPNGEGTAAAEDIRQLLVQLYDIEAPADQAN